MDKRYGTHNQLFCMFDAIVIIQNAFSREHDAGGTWRAGRREGGCRHSRNKKIFIFHLAENELNIWFYFIWEPGRVNTFLQSSLRRNLLDMINICSCVMTLRRPLTVSTTNTDLISTCFLKMLRSTMESVGNVACHQMTSSTILQLKSFGYRRYRALKGLACSLGVKKELKKKAKWVFGCNSWTLKSQYGGEHSRLELQICSGLRALNNHQVGKWAT